MKRGIDVPEPMNLKEKFGNGAEDFAKHHSNWVMDGQKKDQEKHN